jgi:hypothetical protein
MAKLSLGPGRRKGCVSCGRMISVAWLPSTLLLIALSFSTFLGGVFAIVRFGPFMPGGMVLAFVLGALAASIPLMAMYYRFVPLRG